MDMSVHDVTKAGVHRSIYLYTMWLLTPLVCKQKVACGATEEVSPPVPSKQAPPDDFIR